MTDPSLTMPDVRECRKEYHPPVLEDYGEVSELTQASDLLSPSMDGGQSFPAMYASAGPV